MVTGFRSRPPQLGIVVLAVLPTLTHLLVPAALSVKSAAQAAQLAREFPVGHAITFTSSTVPVSTGVVTIPAGRG